MIEDDTALFTTGEPARATGPTVRTICYWSDEGVLSPPTRSAGSRELLCAMKGAGPAAAHREEFAWVVAVLRARVAG